MSNPLKVRFKIGEIEFEAEGSAEDVESQRKAFMEDLLPEAVNAVIKTHSTVKPPNINAVEPILLSSQTESTSDIFSQTSDDPSDMSRESLASFCNSFGNLTDQDFILVAAYFDEKKNGATSFSRESIHKYYQEARRRKHSNLSVPIGNLISKGWIMDAPKVEGSTLLQYVLTAPGLARVDSKDFSSNRTEKKPSKKSSTKKSSARTSSVYSSLCLDDLNLAKYPDVKLLPSLKQQVIMAMYIVTSEAKGELFSVADLQCLITDLWGLPASSKTISNIFTENKSWFKTDTSQKGGVKRKLLEGAKVYARKTIEDFKMPKNNP